MSNYFRITAYHPEQDISVIIDSNGMFEKLWEFSSFMVQKGFKVLEVGTDEKFADVNIEKSEYDTEHIFLRANAKGKPIYSDYQYNNATVRAIQIKTKIYIPETNK